MSINLLYLVVFAILRDNTLSPASQSLRTRDQFVMDIISLLLFKQLMILFYSIFLLGQKLLTSTFCTMDTVGALWRTWHVVRSALLSTASPRPLVLAALALALCCVDLLIEDRMSLIHATLIPLFD